MDAATYEVRWVQPVHKIGRISLVTMCLTTTLPLWYLFFAYGVFPPVDWLVKVAVLITASFGLIWLIEPITFYPALGLAGCYQAFLTGNIGNNKLPSAVLAQDITGVEQGSRAADVVNVLAICGATMTTQIVICIGAVAGVMILDILPATITNAIKAYTVPSIFGALLVSFAMKFPKIIPVAVGVPLLLRYFAKGVPVYWFVLITLVATVAACLVLYKGEIRQPEKE